MIKKYQEFTHAQDSINRRFLSETVNEIVDDINRISDEIKALNDLHGMKFRLFPKEANAELKIEYFQLKSIVNLKFEQIDFTDIHQVIINGIEFKRSGS